MALATRIQNGEPGTKDASHISAIWQGLDYILIYEGNFLKEKFYKNRR